MSANRFYGERLLRAAIRFHPRSFRGEYEQEMVDYYRAVVETEGLRRGAVWRLWFLLKCIGSAMCTGWAQRWRRRGAAVDVGITLGSPFHTEQRAPLHDRGSLSARGLAAMGQDVRYGFRQLRRSPAITVIAVVSLALGIGANVAIFSLAEQMLVRSLPVPGADRLVNLSAPGPKPGSNTRTPAGGSDATFSYPMFRDLESSQQSFSGIAAHRSFIANLGAADHTLNGTGMLVSGAYFSVLGVQPRLGRLLGPDDDRTICGHPVAVLSHRFWETRLGGDPSVLHEMIAVNGHQLTIVGVAPRGFDGTTLGIRADVFVPLTMAGVVGDVRGVASNEQLDDRRNYWLYVFARLKPGISAAHARAALNRIYHPIINQVEAPLQEPMSAAALARFRAKQVVVEDGRRGQSALHGEVGPPLMLLLTVTGIVLLIACANIANLLLARGATRAPELAIRRSLGASRSRLLAQLLTQFCLLAILGGAASLAVAGWTLSLIGAILPAGITASVGLNLSPAMLGFAAALSIGTGLFFGLYPALHTTRPDLIATIRASASHPAGARAAARFRTSLVTAQIALSMALLVLAGLLVRSLVNINHVELGMRADQVVTFRISPKMNGYGSDRARTLFEQAEAQLAGIRGVSSVAASRLPLLTGRGWRLSVSVEGFDPGPDADDGARFNEIGPRYFQTLGIPLVAGREFTSADRGPAPTVAIVNQAFARKFGLGRDAVGKYMALGDDELNIEIVGLVSDAKYHEVKQDVPPQFFFPYRQSDVLDIGAISFYMRTALPPVHALSAVPHTFARLDPNLPVEDLETLRQQVGEQVSQDRMIGILSAVFAGLATLLAAVGLYGVIAYAVARRTREIGLRMALGADSGHVRRMVLWQVGRMILAGGTIGLAAAFALGFAARSLLFEVAPQDPLVFMAATAVLTAVALLAGYLPARRAARVDPLSALRAE